MTGRYSETLGQSLRRERESRSVSLEEVSKVTRISLPILESLERDDFESIPQKEFIPGFLRGYARHLGLPWDEILRRYRTQAELSGRKEKFHQLPLFPGAVPPQEEAEKAATEFREVIPPKEKRTIPWKVLLQIGIVIMALGLSLYLHQALKKAGSGDRDSAPGGPRSENNRKGG